MENLNNQNSQNTIDRSEFLKVVGKSFGAAMLLACVGGATSSCSEDEIADPIVSTPGLVKELNLNDAANASLKTKGGSVKISDKGGILIAKTTASTDEFIAVAAVCTHQSGNLNFRSATTDFVCDLHRAEFKKDGTVQKGPATTAIKKYTVNFDAAKNTLQIIE
ncbi:MAG: ubiquinol-cytochrome c reductase iron-sulfur subunit [Leadbetterella sp.]